MVANEVQAESVLYGNAGAVPGKVYYKAQILFILVT